MRIAEHPIGPPNRPRSGRRRLRTAAGIGALIVLLFFGAIAMGLFSGHRPERLGVSQGRLQPVDETRPNSVSSAAIGDRHRIAPLAVGADPVATFERLTGIVRAYRGASIVVSRPDYLYAEFRTPTLRFVDDVEFLLDPATRVIHVRSASRLGRKDFGVNRQRIETIRERLAAG